ncbi:testis-expressed protein 29 isoform X2 [Mastomys coucha]|nr:testis-expressed protein 29 isoform X2 [Mastomys coucha]
MKYTTEFKRSPPRLLKKFAVCNIPLYNICDYNVTRDQCRRLGCCFYKAVCYEKVVPVYVQVFFALIMFVAGAFIMAIVYSVGQGIKKKPKPLPPEEFKESVYIPTPESPTPVSSPVRTPVPSPVRSLVGTPVLTPVPSIKKTESPVQVPVTTSKPEENKEVSGGSAVPQPAP